jgi:hypothetical protein
MKKAFSLLLALIMVMSLFGVMGVSALADEENEGVTVLVTGGLSQTGDDGLSYAALAAWKNTYEDNAVLLVDAGGFDASAVEVMNAAGYDLAVPDQTLEGADFACVSVGLEGLSAGACLTKNNTSVAVIGLSPMGETEAEEYYAAIQKNVEAAIGADFIIAVGQTEDGEALVENVPGLNAVVLLADDLGETVVSTGEETSALVSTVSADGVAVLKLSADGIEGSHATAEDVLGLDLGEDENVAAVEAAWLESLLDTEETEDAQEAEEADPAAEEETEEAEEPVQDAQEAEVEDVLQEGDVEEQDEIQESASGSDAVTEPDPTPAQQESAVTTSDAVLDTDQSTEDPAVTEEPETTEEPEATPEPTAEPTPEPTPAVEEIAFARGTENLTVSGLGGTVVKVAVSSSVLVEGNDYVLTDDGTTVTLQASTLNYWGDGTYTFSFTLNDGTEVQKRINISGDYTAPESTAVPTTEPVADPTATEEPTPTAAPTATPTPDKGSNPATGDNSPIMLYVVILVVLVAALVVVIVLATKKKKK